MQNRDRSKRTDFSTRHLDLKICTLYGQCNLQCNLNNFAYNLCCLSAASRSNVRPRNTLNERQKSTGWHAVWLDSAGIYCLRNLLQIFGLLRYMTRQQATFQLMSQLCCGWKSNNYWLTAFRPICEWIWRAGGYLAQLSNGSSLKAGLKRGL